MSLSGPAIMLEYYSLGICVPVNECTVSPSEKKNVACWGFKSMCAESLSPLHILFFYSLFPFGCYILYAE